MQSNNNNEMAGAALAIGALWLMFQALVLIGLGIGVVLAFVMTVLCLRAWHHPIEIMGEIITPQEARAFVNRGLKGALIGLIMGLPGDFANPEAGGGITLFGIIGGYCIGSLGIQWMIEHAAKVKAEQEAANRLPTLPPPPPRAPYSSYSTYQREYGSPDEPPPFDYARWDDEDEWR